jgi:hypothetical protein
MQASGGCWPSSWSTVAAAIPATLLPFFVADRLQASELQPVLLLASSALRPWACRCG